MNPNTCMLFQSVGLVGAVEIEPTFDALKARPDALRGKLRLNFYTPIWKEFWCQFWCQLVCYIGTIAGTS